MTVRLAGRPHRRKWKRVARYEPEPPQTHQKVLQRNPFYGEDESWLAKVTSNKGGN